MGFLFVIVLLWLGAGVSAVVVACKYDTDTSIDTFEDLGHILKITAMGPISLFTLFQQMGDVKLPWRK